MGNIPLWFIAAFAVAVFWALGAYNRLARLRAAVGKAFAALDEQLLRQLVWLQGSLPAHLRGGNSVLMEDEPPDTDAAAEAAAAATTAWLRLRAAGDQFGVALAQARAKPMDADRMAALVLAHEAMRSAWASALQDAVAPDAVPSPERLQQRWMRLLHQCVPLRAAFNDAVAAYNQAVGQFPAAVLARMVGFRPAGGLTRLAEARA